MKHFLVILLALCTIAAEPPVKPGLPRLAGPRGDSFLTIPNTKSGFERVLPKYELPAAAFPDTVEIVHLMNARPIRVRVQLQVNGKPLGEVWQQHLRKLFNAFDRDRDGSLNRFEADNVFSPKGLISLLNGVYYNGSIEGGKPFEELDRDRDNRVSFAEFAVSYDEATSDLVRFRQRTIESELGQSLTKELFRLLDSDQDGKLSKRELDRAETLLIALDANENEGLSPDEIQNRARPQLGRAVATTMAANAPQPAVAKPDEQRLFVFQNELPASAKEQARKIYGTKFPIPDLPDFFAKINVSRDFSGHSAELKPRDGKLPPDCELRIGERGRVVLKVGNQLLDLSTATVQPEAQQRRLDRMVNETFPAGKQVVSDSEIGGPNMQFLRVVFDPADGNADGRLTREEYRQYLQLQQDTIDLALTATYATRRPNLFQLLDANGDNLLSVRELRTAWKQLIVLEPSGEFVTQAAMQPSASVRFAIATYEGEDYSRPINPFAVPGASKVSGPLWFQKMDRNGDRDVSRREFIGPREKFDEIDTDRDDLISIAEATAHDAKTRK